MKKPLLLITLEGVLLRLRIDHHNLRRKLRQLFEKHNASYQSSMLYYGLESSLALIQNEEKKQKLKQAAIELIYQHEEQGVETLLLLPGIEEITALANNHELILLSGFDKVTTQKALAHAEINAKHFCDIFYRHNQSHDNTVAFVKQQIAKHPSSFWISSHERDIKIIHELNAKQSKVVSVAVGDDRDLIAACPDYLVSDFGELPKVLRGQVREDSLSIVILAYNEQETIETAVKECDLFCQRHFSDWQIVVVNDGSKDRTAEILTDLVKRYPKLEVIDRQQNGGMGAGMRDGYQACNKDYICFLPGDRQVRAGNLIAFLPYLQPRRVVVSTYLEQPSGLWRAFQSLGFRWCIRRITGLTTNFEGSYMVPLEAMGKAKPETIACDTFFYSFELLQRLQLQGLNFHRVFMRPFRREFGQSHVSNIGKILTILKEMLRSRKAQKSQ